MESWTEEEKVHESKEKRKKKSEWRRKKEYPHKTKNGAGIVGEIIKEN